MKKPIQKEANRPLTAIAYYRFSSHSQNEASIDQQRDKAHEYAKAHGMTIIREYKDEAISGTTDERPGFQNMLFEAKKLKPDCLIIWKTDRLARDRITSSIAKAELRRIGCKIEYVAECIPDTPEGVIMESMLEGMAEYYSKQLSCNVKRGMYFNAENGLYNGHKTFGYTVDKKTKKSIIDKDTAPVVIKIFSDFSDGKPIVNICEELNAAGIKTVHGNKFTINSIRAILKNKAYIGVYHFGEFTIPDGVPRIISDDLFDRAQKRFKRNRHVNKAKLSGNEPDYWLTGKLRCGICGGAICGKSGTSKTGKIHYYYSCINHRKHKCMMKDVNKEKIEVHVAWTISEFLNDSENLASLAVDIADHMSKLCDNRQYIKALEAQLKDVNMKIDNLVKALESASGAPDVVFNRINELNTQKNSIEATIQNERIKHSLSHDDYSIQKYFEMYSHADFNDPETREKLLEYIIDAIYLYDDRIAVKFWFSDDRTEISLDTLTEVVTGKSKTPDNKRVEKFALDAPGSAKFY